MARPTTTLPPTVSSTTDFLERLREDGGKSFDLSKFDEGTATMLARDPRTLYTACLLPTVNASIVPWLLGAGAKIDHIMLDQQRQTALHAAAQGLGKTHTVFKVFLERCQKLVNVRDATGSTPLHYAALRGYSAAYAMMIAAGADATIRDNNGDVPHFLMMVALSERLIQMKKDIMAFGKGVTEERKSYAGIQVRIFKAILKDDVAVLDRFFELGGSAAMRDCFGEMSMSEAAAEAQSWKCYRSILDNGGTAIEGCTPPPRNTGAPAPVLLPPPPPPAAATQLLSPRNPLPPPPAGSTGMPTLHSLPSAAAPPLHQKAPPVVEAAVSPSAANAIKSAISNGLPELRPTPVPTRPMYGSVPHAPGGAGGGGGGEGDLTNSLQNSVALHMASMRMSLHPSAATKTMAFSRLQILAAQEGAEPKRPTAEEELFKKLNMGGEEPDDDSDEEEEEGWDDHGFTIRAKKKPWYHQGDADASAPGVVLKGSATETTPGAAVAAKPANVPSSALASNSSKPASTTTTSAPPGNGRRVQFNPAGNTVYPRNIPTTTISSVPSDPNIHLSQTNRTSVFQHAMNVARGTTAPSVPQ